MNGVQKTVDFPLEILILGLARVPVPHCHINPREGGGTGWDLAGLFLLSQSFPTLWHSLSSAREPRGPSAMTYAARPCAHPSRMASGFDRQDPELCPLFGEVRIPLRLTAASVWPFGGRSGQPSLCWLFWGVLGRLQRSSSWHSWSWEIKKTYSLINELTNTSSMASSILKIQRWARHGFARSPQTHEEARQANGCGRPTHPGLPPAGPVALPGGPSPQSRLRPRSSRTAPSSDSLSGAVVMTSALAGSPEPPRPYSAAQSVVPPLVPLPGPSGCVFRFLQGS